MDSQYQSIIQYAREHSISDMTVRRRIKTGKLYAVLRDGKYLIPLTEKKDEVVLEPKKEVPQRSSFSSVEETKPFVSREQKVPSQIYSQKKEQKSPRDSLKRLESFLSSSDKKSSVSESKKIIDLCEKVLVKVKNSEFFLEEKFNKRFEMFESELSLLRSKFENKKSKVNLLERRVEDLKMLVDIMEEDRFV